MKKRQHHNDSPEREDCCYNAFGNKIDESAPAFELARVPDDELGERISTAQSGITNRTVTTYETVSGVVWRVTTATRLTATTAKVARVTKERLTGLSDGLRSEVVTIDASGRETVARKVFDPASNIVVTVTTVDGAETKVDRSSYGLLLSTSSIDGSEEYEYDALGRKASASTFAVGSDVPRSRRMFSYDVSDNIVDTVTDYGSEGTATASSVFDALGREVSSTDVTARTVETGYDGMGRMVSVGGDTHPLMFGYDSAGRKTQGLTTRDDGETWDATTWIYDPLSGLNMFKRYAGGSRISYAYTDNGRRTRTTLARGVWKENAYDANNRISSVAYSDGTPAVAYSYTDAGKVSEAAVAGGAQYVYGYDSRLLCTNEAVSVGVDRVDVVRTYDDRSRCDHFAVEVTNVAHAVKTRRFDAFGRVVGYGITNACGRGMTATLQYTGSRVDGIAYALPNGRTFTSAFTRSPSRPDLVTRRDYRFGTGSIYWYETGYDLAGRPTNAVDSVSLARAYLYDRRNELAEALVGTNAFAYAYDTIGNRTSDTFNGASRNYAANCLNQYTQVDAAQMVYDADGNLLRDDCFAYAYDAENRLVSVRPIASSEGDLAVVNAYDYKHRRVMKRVEQFDGDVWQTSETHTFAYDGCNIVLERIAFADGTTRTVEYFWGNDLSGSEQGAGGVGGLLAISIDGAFFIPCYDHNGNIVCYVSESGAIAAQFVFDPYGNVIDQYGDMPDQFAFGFSTKYLDRETDLIAYQCRFYRPDHGRWLNRDPIEEKGGVNLYGFCKNNPTKFLDRSGLDVWVENTKAVYGLHQRVCVTVWAKDKHSKFCCNGVRYRKSGSFCISFGMKRGGNTDSTDSYSGDGGSSDSDSSGDSSTSGNEAIGNTGKSEFPDGFDGPNDNGDGSVYPDNRDPSTGVAFFLSTDNNPCVDIDILNYMKGLIGQSANYSIIFQNCRSFSQAVFNRFN